MHAGLLYGKNVLSPESAIAASVGSLPISIGQGKTSRTTQEPGWEEHWLASGTRRTVDLAKIIVIEVIDQIPGRARR